MSKKDKGLATTAAIIAGRYYRVEDFPYERAVREGPNVLRKGIAYRFNTDMTKGLFPFRGTIGKKESWSPYAAETGVYVKEKEDGTWIVKLSYPKDKKEREEHSLKQEHSIAAAVLDHDYAPEQFTDIRVNIGDHGEAFMPPISLDDDPMNKAVKMAIRTKEAPFEPYGKRLEALAVNKNKGIEGINIRNNMRRALKNNRAMSPSKAMVCCDTWQLEMAIILRDAPGSMHPMFTDGEMLIEFPSGLPFEIDPAKLININDMVADAISETKSQEEKPGDDDDADIYEEDM